jgi:hypothetical protein
MATLTDQDYGALRRIAYRAGYGKEELKALPNLPKKSQLKAAFQAIEDGMLTTPIPAGAVGMTVIAALKGRTETAIGQTVPMALFVKLFDTWVRWRVQ